MSILRKEEVPLSQLQGWSDNPRGILKEDFLRLKKQIIDLGVYSPLVVNEDYVVLSGNMRLKAFQELNIDPVWVVVVEARDKATMTKYALSANDRAGYYEKDSLAELIHGLSLEEYHIDLGATYSVMDILDEFIPVKEDGHDDASFVSEEAVSKKGEVYQLGRHRLICGDSTDPDTYLKLMGDAKARLIFTDPPYNVDYSYDWRSSVNKGKKVEHNFFNDKKEDEDYYAFVRDVFSLAYAHSTDDVNFYCWYAMKYHGLMDKAIRESGMYVSQVVIWIKNYPVLSMGQHFHRTYEPCLHGWKDKKKAYHTKVSNFRDVLNWDEIDYLTDMWYEKRDNILEYEHPTQKPIRLAERALKKSSQKGDIVLDMFGGSGSTLIACEQTKRICYMMELDPLYVDVIRRRYQKFVTGDEKGWEDATPVC